MTTVDLVVAGAIISNPLMIRNAIRSVPDFDYLTKTIIIDGVPSSTLPEREAEHGKYVADLMKEFPEFTVIHMTSNVYFRKAIESLKLDADYSLIIQDDVILQEFNLNGVLNDMIKKEVGWLTFPHKEITTSTHWYEIPEDQSGDMWKVYGVSERVFIVNNKTLQQIFEKFKDRNTKREVLFIEAIFHRKMLGLPWKRGTIDKDEYWATWQSYLHMKIIHYHQVGKRF